jgi:uncharacterized protein YbaR (Trm112 family)
MTLSRQLLEILACPKCKGEIAFDESQKQIVCHACQMAFPIRDDIPIMLIDEAMPFDGAAKTAPG